MLIYFRGIAMTNLDIETFWAVVQHGTMTAAAEALYITQPTLSMRIRALEERVGTPLFIRGKGQRRIRLTAAGQKFLTLALVSASAIAASAQTLADAIKLTDPATKTYGFVANGQKGPAVAQDWIKLGRAKRVIVISADDITNDNVSEWILTAFLASGAATTEADVTKAALPFEFNSIIGGLKQLYTIV